MNIFKNAAVAHSASVFLPVRCVGWLVHVNSTFTMLRNVPTALSRATARLSRGDLHHAVGRFKLARQTYSCYQNAYQRFNADFHHQRLQPQETSFLKEVSPKQCVQDLRENAVAFGLQLPPADISGILQFAQSTPCREPGIEGDWYASEVNEGKLKGTRHVFRGLVQQLEACSSIEKILRDSVLLETVRRYLGYWPTRVEPILTWSFVSDLPLDEQKRQYPPLNYHYDVAGYNFMTAYFYITDVDARSGAHIMIQKSHNKKPAHTLFLPYSQIDSEEQLLDYYGKESKLVIEGGAGFGYLQDPSCFHRLSSPETRRRLLLQIRYA